MNLVSFERLLDTEMDRKQFLAYLGAAILTIIGIRGIMQALLEPLDTPNTSRQRVMHGYGHTPYGGGKE